MNGVRSEPLKRIPVAGGDVWRGLRSDDAGFAGFGEAYFSCIEPRAVKGWKRHTRMVLNLIVPKGTVGIVLHDGSAFEEHVLSADDDARYQRLTIQPGLWMAFCGLAAGTSILMNVASLIHDPQEAEQADLTAVPWDWPDFFRRAVP